MNMKTLSRNILYVDEFEANDARHRDVSLRTGSAGWLYAGDDGSLRNEVRLTLSPNSTHALIGHGVVDALNELPLQGRLGTGMEVLIPPAQLDSARELFYRADTKTYGASHEFVVDAHEGVEYRLRIDNREYQNTLSELQYLLRRASHDGMAIWLMI